MHFFWTDLQDSAQTNRRPQAIWFAVALRQHNLQTGTDDKVEYPIPSSWLVTCVYVYTSIPAHTLSSFFFPKGLTNCVVDKMCCGVCSVYIYIAVMGKWLLFLLITVRFSYLKNLDSKNFSLVMGIWKKIRIQTTVGWFSTISKPLKEQLGFMSKMAMTQASSFPNAYFWIFQRIVNRGFVSGLGIRFFWYPWLYMWIGDLTFFLEGSRRVSYEFYEPPWFLEGVLVQFLITAQHWHYSSVGWVFEFVDSYQFWFLKIFQH